MIFFALTCFMHVLQPTTRVYNVDGRTEKLTIKFFATKQNVQVCPQFVDHPDVFPLKTLEIDLGDRTVADKTVKIDWYFHDTEDKVAVTDENTQEQVRTLTLTYEH